MKKCIKMAFCLTLVIMLMMTMTAPAIAVKTGSGNYGQYSFTWTVTRAETYGRSTITTSGVPTNVSAYAKNQMYNERNQQYGTSESDGVADNVIVYTDGYASVMASANNEFQINGVWVVGVINSTYGSFKVNGAEVAQDTD